MLCLEYIGYDLEFNLQKFPPNILWQKLLCPPETIGLETHNPDDPSEVAALVNEQSFYQQSFRGFGGWLWGAPLAPMTLFEVIAWYREQTEDPSTAMENLLFAGVRKFPHYWRQNRGKTIAGARQALVALLQHFATCWPTAQPLYDTLVGYTHYVMCSPGVPDPSSLKKGIYLYQSDKNTCQAIIIPPKNHQARNRVVTFTKSENNELLQTMAQWPREAVADNKTVVKTRFPYTLTKRILSNGDTPVSGLLDTALQLRSLPAYSVVWNFLVSHQLAPSPKANEEKGDLKAHQYSVALHAFYGLMRQLQRWSGPVAELLIFYQLFWRRDYQREFDVLRDEENCIHVLSKEFYIFYSQYLAYSNFAPSDVAKILLCNTKLTRLLAVNNESLLIKLLLAQQNPGQDIPFILANNSDLYALITPEIWLHIAQKDSSYVEEVYKDKMIWQDFSSTQHYQLIKVCLLSGINFYNASPAKFKKFIGGIENDRDLIHLMSKGSPYYYSRGKPAQLILAELTRRSVAFGKLVDWLRASEKNTAFSFYQAKEQWRDLSSQEQYDLVSVTVTEFSFFCRKKAKRAADFLHNIKAEHLNKLLNLNDKKIDQAVNNELERRLSALLKKTRCNKNQFSYGSCKIGHSSISDSPSIPMNKKRKKPAWTTGQKILLAAMVAGVMIGGGLCWMAVGGGYSLR